MFHCQTKKEEILSADGFANLDVGAVERGDGKCPVHGELHVPGARSLRAGRGDLLAQVGRRIDQLAKSHVISGQEHDFEAVLHIGILVDDVAH